MNKLYTPSLKLPTFCASLSRISPASLPSPFKYHLPLFPLRTITQHPYSTAKSIISPCVLVLSNPNSSMSLQLIKQSLRSNRVILL